MEVQVEGELDKAVLVDMFRKGIAEALQVPISSVVDIKVNEVTNGQGLRRLQALQTKRYEVSYEVLPPKSIDPEVVAEKANLITSANTTEFQVFKETLQATSGVAEVGEIVSKVPAYTFQDETANMPPQTPTDPSEGSTSPVPLVVGGAVGFIAILLVGGALFYRRKVAANDAREALRRAAGESDAEAGVIPRVPSNTLLGSPASKLGGKDSKKNWIALD